MSFRLDLFILCAACSLLYPTKSNAQLVINELMQSNVDCIMDELNDFPDSWVELYNAGEESVNLSHYALSLTTSLDSIWQLPDVNVEPTEHILIYCDKVASGLHTHFRLESGKGGSVYLLCDKVVVDKVEGMKKQPAPNVAYGRQEDASVIWGYQEDPTPGEPNCGKLCDEVLGTPVFYPQGGIYSEGTELYVEITVPEGTPDEATIRYTTDGREPTINDPIYYSGILISGHSYVVRAKIFCDGYLPSRSVTQSYIILDRPQSIPVVSLVTDERYMYDEDIGIYVDGNQNDGTKNYEQNWRRPVNVEYFEPAEWKSVVNQLGEMRVAGGASRKYSLKSLFIYANKRFGKKRLSHEFFANDKPGREIFKSLMLRNAGNDFQSLYMRDAIIQRSMGLHADIDWQAWQPTIVFFNGRYLGMLNLRERSDEDNVFTNHGGLEDIDLLEGWGNLKEGDKKNFYDFRTFYREPGHSQEEYEQKLDWQEFFNLMILNLYFNNQDFPGGNIVLWRPRTVDGRWRFIAKDTDFGLGAFEKDPHFTTLDWLYHPEQYAERNWANAEASTILFKNMMENDDLRREFIDRAAVFMGDFLNERIIRAKLDSMYNIVKDELQIHRTLYPGYNMESELIRARLWLSERTPNFYQQLSDFFVLGPPVALSINKGLTDEELYAVDFVVNGVPLSTHCFEGYFFAGRELNIVSVPKNMQVERWIVTQENEGGSMYEQEFYSSEFTFEMPTCKRVSIRPQLDYYDGIASTSVKPMTQRQGDRLIIKGITKGENVTLYTFSGVLIYQTVSDGNDLSVPVRSGHAYLLRCGNSAEKILP